MRFEGPTEEPHERHVMVLQHKNKDQKLNFRVLFCLCHMPNKVISIFFPSERERDAPLYPSNTYVSLGEKKVFLAFRRKSTWILFKREWQPQFYVHNFSQYFFFLLFLYMYQYLFTIWPTFFPFSLTPLICFFVSKIMSL